MGKMHHNNNTVYAINPAVDVYAIGDDVIEFYFINNRRRVTMHVSPQVVALVANIDGRKGIEEICESLFIGEKDNVQAFVDYLFAQAILLIPEDMEIEKSQMTPEDVKRYDRQINYFTSLYMQSGYHAQQKIQQQKILIFGIGAIGTGIAIQLAMSGVRHFILVDKDVVTEDSIQRHYFFKESYIGMTKCDALTDYLMQIDRQVKCEVHNDIVDFDTDITPWIEQASFVVNTLDEPYIGLTSMKIGRACYALRKPLYVAGGFDAHLMSTGELIIPDETPCVDCYTTYFKDTLKNWNPKYNIEAVSEEHAVEGVFEVGGLPSMALFSVSYAMIVILNYMVTEDAHYSQGRGELLFDKLHIDYLNVLKNPNCHVCGNQ